MTHAEILALFTKVGAIELVDWPRDPSGVSLRAIVPRDTKGPGVYAWVEHSCEGDPTILYIGKAGYGVSKRHDRHTGGFRDSPRGRSHAVALREVLARGSTISVHAYYPHPARIAALPGPVPVHASVEDYLIDAADPTPMRNREHREP